VAADAWLVRLVFMYVFDGIRVTALKMEATCSTVTSADLMQTARRYVSKDFIITIASRVLFSFPWLCILHNVYVLYREDTVSGECGGSARYANNVYFLKRLERNSLCAVW
jgi:hypothetical protein